MNQVLADAIARLTLELPAGEADRGDPAGGWGRELVCVLDCTDSFATTTDPRTILLQALARRFDTPRGTLPAHEDDDYGFPLLSLLHEGITSDDLDTMQGKIAGEMKQDPRVETVIVRVTYAAHRLTVTGLVTPRDPRVEPFGFVMTVDDAAIMISER